MFSHVKGMGEIQTEETPKINTFQTMRKEVSGMAVFRIEKTRDYTVMSNHHLRDMSLSLKAKGLLSLMLSLPENWDYTMKGLARICKDGIDSISGGIRELEEHGYLIRERVRGANGQLGSIEYTILEQPKEPTPAQEKPIRENPVQVNPTLVTPVQEEPAQLNKEESSNYPSRTDLSSTELSNPIRSNPPTPVGARMGTDGMGARECYREVILDNIEYSYLVQDSHIDREQLDEIVDLIVDTVCSARKVIRIAGDDYPAEVVKSRFMKLDSSHVQYVMDCMKDNTTYGYVKDPDNKDFWIIDEEAAEVVRLIFRLFIGGKNRNQIAVYLTQEQIPTPTFYMKDRGRGTCKNKTLNEDNRCKWNKATLTNILTRQEYCGDVVNFKTTKHFRDKHNHYVDRSQWHITENVHEPIISRSDFETVQRILENASVRRPNGDGEIHPLSGLLFCKDCGAKMHIRIDYRNGGKRHVAYCSEYHKGKAKNPKCHSPHIMDADLLMQTIAEVLKKIEDYSISNRAEFEVLVKKNLAMQQTDQSKKQQKRIPQITTRLEQIDKVLNKLYEDNALGTIPQDRYEQMSQKYSEEYYALKAELATLQEQLSAYENAGGRAQKFLKLTERHAAFTDLTPAILNEFISRIEVHERDQKRARYAIQHISIYFNYIGKFENEVTQLAEPTEQEIRQMREEIEEAKKEKSRAYHRQYSREYRARNLEKQREYDRMKAREYRARRKAQAAAAQPTQ